MTALRHFWRGELPLGEAFWLWGVLGGGVVSLFATLLVVMLLSLDAPAWLVVVLFVGHIPVNLFLLVGVWRSTSRPEVGENARLLARIAMAVWAALLCLV